MISARNIRRATRCGAFAAASLCAAIVSAYGAEPAGPVSIHNLAANDMGWAPNGGDFVPVAGEKFKPVLSSPEHPYCGNGASPICNNTVNPRIADTTNPILQPWAAKQMAEYNQEVLNGKEAFNAMSRCWPTGVPGILNFTAAPTYYLQTPKEITIFYTRGTNVRHVYMDVAHTKAPKPSWYGESVGHYESDVLVVDTIGSNGKAFADFYRTPTSTKIHTVERYSTGMSNDIADWGQAGRKPNANGPILIAKITVDDPGTFTTPWSAMKYYAPRFDAISDAEEVCAEGENNETNFFSQDSVPVPWSQRPDF